MALAVFRKFFLSADTFHFARLNREYKRRQSPRRVVVPCSHIQPLPSQENPTRFGRMLFYFFKVLYYEKEYHFILYFENSV